MQIFTAALQTHMYTPLSNGINNKKYNKIFLGWWLHKVVQIRWYFVISDNGDRHGDGDSDGLSNVGVCV
jgi:hypothetical protein